MHAMHWDDVRLFLAVAEHGSLARAARQLELDHSTLSRRMAALERELGAPLFLRGARGVRTSPQGEHVLEQAKAVEAAMNGFARASAGLALEHEKGHVRLATSGILANDLLAPHMGELRKLAPDVELEWMVGRRLVELSRYEADIALRLRPRGVTPAEPSVIAVRLASVTWGLYRSRKSAKTRPRLIRYAGSGLEPGAQFLSEHFADAEVTSRVDYVPTALALAKAGAGMAALPCFCADAHPELERVASNLESYALFAAVHADMRRVSRVARVLQWLKASVQAERTRLLG
jgi:DNA-binding transcriptional LysR family regulator